MNQFFFNLPDGRQLSWYEKGAGPPLVLLHGWAMSAAVYREMAETLCDDFRLLIPDLPGHGESAPPSQCVLGDIADDLACWLESVEQSPMALVGWSLGGMLALELASTSRLAIEKLVLVATTPQFTLSDAWPFGLPSAQVHALSRNLRRRFEVALGEFFALTFAGEEISPERLREIRRFAVYQGCLPDREAASKYLDLLASQDQRDLVASVEQPTLVIHGDLDNITPVAAARKLAGMLPQGSLLEYPGVGHAPFLSRPVEVAAEIRRFCHGAG